MNTIAYTGLVLAMALVGCGGGGEKEGDVAGDPQLLAQYRAAIPGEAQLKAPAPQASGNAKVGDPAIYPAGSQEIVAGVNGAVTGIIETMRFIVSLEPTIYDSDKKEFIWGPYPDQDGVGTVAAFIKDAGEGAEFRYQYALLRGVNNDVATMTPVIWGGATPDAANEDHGAGVTLWDFEANRAFEEANNPDFASEKLDRGRFAAVYQKGAEEKGELALVVSAFRGFVPKDSPETEPVDLDYFYGRWADGTSTIDFVDWKSAFDLNDDPAKAAAESVSVHMAFLNEGTGRAEVEASEGDFEPDQKAAIVECWDASLAETYISLTTSKGGVDQGTVADGDAASCGLFQATLAELGVPSLGDVNPKLLADLQEVAKNGVPSK